MSRSELVEGIVMLLCIAVLWPAIRAMRGGPEPSPFYRILLIAVVVVLGYITYRRVQRMRAAFRERRRGPGPPFGPN